jgi:HSP20 family protein
MLSRYNVPSSLWPTRGAGASRFSADEMLRQLFQDVEMAFHRPLLETGRRMAPSPQVQVRQTPDGAQLLVDLPGYRQEDVELAIEGATVTLRVAAPPAAPREGFTALYRERARGALEWSLELPFPIDATTAAATLEHGRLAVALPKAPEAKPRLIPVKAA